MKKPLFFMALVLVGVVILTGLIRLATRDDEGPVDNKPGVTATPEAWGDNVLIICLDPGHGGGDVGASDGADRLEKDDNLAMALALKAALEALDVEVLMTRDGDEGVSYADRVAVANDAGADYFLSLHRNSGGGKGVELWLSSKASRAEKRSAQALLDAVTEASGYASRGVKTGKVTTSTEDYRENADTLMPSAIMELGFMDRAADNDIFDDRLEAMAEALALALCKELGASK